MEVELGAGQLVSLRAVDPSVLGAAGRVDSLVALQRLRSWVDAHEQVLSAAMAGPGDPPRSGAPGSAVSEKQFMLECLCARHHALKHEAGWTVTGDAGTLTWTTPTGHSYLDPPGQHPVDRTAEVDTEDDQADDEVQAA